MLAEVKESLPAQILGGVIQLFLDAQQLVVLGHAVGAAGGAGLDLAGVQGHGQVSDGGVCRLYTATEIAQIYIAAQTLITTQTTYHNALKAYVQSLDGAEEISAVTYGMTLPEPYLSEMNAKLAVAQAQMNAIMAKLGN